MARKPRKQAGTFPLKPLEERALQPLFRLDADLELVWANHAWEELVGGSLDFVRETVRRALGSSSPADPPDLAAGFRPPSETLAGRPAAVPALILRPDGERLYRVLEFWPFTDGDGGLIGILGLVRPDGSPPVAPGSPTSELHVELLQTRRALRERHGIDGLVGAGPAHARLLEQVRLAATTRAPVLILGEAGTGKRLVAQTIHQLGPAHDQPLIPCDCQALAPELLERELFGDHDGAGSTFLLREIVFLPRELQVKLAAAIGGSTRLIATSSHDPDTALADLRMAPELYFTLTTLVLRLPPLRERRDEIPLLAQHFLEQANQRGGVSKSGFSPDAVAALRAYDWPGNLRELSRVVVDCHTRAQGVVIEPADLPRPILGNLEASAPLGTTPRPVKPLDDLLIEIERRLIETAITESRGNKSRAADLLGISRPRLYRRIQELESPHAEPDDHPPVEPSEP